MCNPLQEIKNLGNSVGNTVNNTVNWVVNEVVDPVVTTVDKVVESALDNPVKTIAQIAAISTGNAWALPLIEGADVAAKGGDIGDVLEATAKAYVAQEVGSYVGGGASTAATKATGSAVAGQIIGSGAAAASVAIVTGQDPVKAFVSGGVGAGTSAMLGKIDANTGGKFAKLPPAARNVITAAITAQLTNNPNPNAAIINSLIASSGIVTEAINSFDPQGTKLDNTQRAILTDVLMGTTTAALSGGNPSAALQAALMKNGAKALGDMATDTFKNATKSADTSYKTAETKANQLDTNETAQKAALKKYNDTATELQKKIQRQDVLKVVYDTTLAIHNKNPSAGSTQAVNDAVKAYNDYVAVLNKEYTDTYKPALEKYGGELDKLKETHAVLKGDYETAIQAFATKTDTLSDVLKPTYEISDKIFVEALDPNFNATEYKKLNGLPTDTNAYQHYLNKGQTESLLTNNKAAESSFSAEKVRLIQELADKKGISLSQIDDADAKTFFANINTKYGGDLYALKNASIQDLLTGNTKTLDDLLKVSKSQDFIVEIDGTNYGGWKPPANYDVPAGMKLATQEEHADNKSVLSYTNDGKPVWISVDKGITTWNPETLTLTYKTPEAAEVASKVTSESLKNDDPQAWLIAANQIKYDGDNAATKFLYDYAENVMNYAKSTGNSTVMNAAGNALKAGGGILQSFNGLVVLAGLNPNSTATGKFAEKLVSLGKATTTAEYQAAIADMNKTMASGSGVIGTGKAIWGAFKDHPTEFLAEIIGVEGMQELVPLLIGGGATTAVKGLALARGMGTKLAAEWSTKAGISAAVASDIAESVGGSAEGAFNQAYKLALSKGMTEAQATKVALQIAGKTGLTSGVITALSMKVGGSALEKAILGKTGNGELASVIDALGKKMAEGGKVTVKEGVSEGIEEGLSAAYLEGQLYQLDPTRDVVGNITSNTIIGAIAGGGVAGGAYAGANTGSAVANLLITSNPQIATTINSSTDSAAAVKALDSLGITDTKLQANLLNNKYDAAYTSTDEATDALRSRTDFTYSDADINALTGQGTDATLASRTDAYVDPKVLDIEEVKAAALAEGYTLTNEEAAKLIGQKDEAAGVAAVKTQYDPLAVTEQEAKDFFKAQGYTPTAADLAAYTGNKKESDTKAAIDTKYDSLAVTEQEARDFFAKEGYTPTAADIAAYVGNKKETDIGTQIAAKYDPLAVTEQEAKDFFAAQGYTPTAADIAAYVGNKKEADTKTAIDTKYDPLAVTKEEATAAAKGENYTLTDKEIANYIGNKSETDTLAAIIKYVDPNAVTEAEAKAFFAEQGYPPSTEELAAYIGQKSEAQIAKDVATYADPKAVTAAEAKAFFDSQGYPATDAQIKQFTKVADETQVGKDVAAYVDPRQVTYNEAESFLTGLGYKPTKEEINKFVTSSADTIQTAIQGDVAKYVDPLLVDKDEVKQSFIDAGFKDVTDADVERFIGQYAEKDLSGKVTSYLPIATYNKTTEQIAGVKTDILSKVAEYETAGKTRDEALSLAIGDVAADLGTTREEILGIIGTPAVADDPATKDINEAKPATGIYGELGNIKTDVQTKYDSLTQGQKDLADQLTKQGVDLNTAIATAKGELQGQIGNLQNVVGQDIQQATQSDLDAVIKMLETQGAYDPQYDYNGDKVIDQNDKTAIQEYIRSQEPGYTPDTDTPFIYNPAAGSKWGRTGVFKTVADEAEATRQAQATEAEKTRQANAQAALKTQRMGNINQMVNMLGQAEDTGGQQVTVKAADPAKIGYVYDFNSIFANPAQANMFVSPYAEGGLVDGSDDVNDELLKILKG